MCYIGRHYITINSRRIVDIPCQSFRQGKIQLTETSLAKVSDSMMLNDAYILEECAILYRELFRWALENDRAKLGESCLPRILKTFRFLQEHNNVNPICGQVCLDMIQALGMWLSRTTIRLTNMIKSQQSLSIIPRNLQLSFSR
jgi:hypothetical protein